MKLCTTLPNGGEVMVMSPPKGCIDMLRGFEDTAARQEVSDATANEPKFATALLNQGR